MQRQDLEKRKIFDFKALSTPEFDRLDESTKKERIAFLEKLQNGDVPLKLSKRSIELYKMGKPGQGYVGFIDLQTGEVDLVPAYNKDDKKARDDFLYGEGKKQKNYVFISNEPLGKNTGQVHMDGLKLIEKGHKGAANGYIAGFGIFKGDPNDRHNKYLLSEFRNKSFSQNKFAFQYDELFLLVNYDTMIHIERSIPGEITQRLISQVVEQLESEVLTHQENDVHSILKNFADNIEQEKKFQQLSVTEIRDKLIENMFAALKNEQVDVIKRIIALESRVISSPDQPPVTLGQLGLSIHTKYNGETLLATAINTNKNIGIIEGLIKLGADVSDLSVKEKLKLIEIRTSASLHDSARKDLDSRISETTGIKHRLVTAAENNDVDAVRNLLANDKDNELINEKSRLLHNPSILENEDVIQVLIEQNADVNHVTEFGITPLAVAAAHGLEAAVDQLIENGANSKFIDPATGNSILHDTDTMDNERIVSQLIEHGADPCHQNKNGATPFSIAIENRKHTTIIAMMDSLLAQSGEEQFVAKLKAIRLKNNAPILSVLLLHAAEEGRSELARILIKQGADIGYQGEGLQTPLHAAFKSGGFSGCQLSHIEALLSAPGSQSAINAQNKRGESPLHIAADLGRSDIVKLLCEHGADVNQTVRGVTPLGAALISSRRFDDSVIVGFDPHSPHTEPINTENVVSILIDKGADPNLDHSNPSLLSIAVADKLSLTIISALLKGGADVNSLNEKEKTELLQQSLRENPARWDIAMHMLLALPPAANISNAKLIEENITAIKNAFIDFISGYQHRHQPMSEAQKQKISDYMNLMQDNNQSRLALFFDKTEHVHQSTLVSGGIFAHPDRGKIRDSILKHFDIDKKQPQQITHHHMKV